LIVSARLANGTVDTQVGTFVVINSDGWAFTAGHLFDSFVKFQSDQKKIKEAAEMNDAKPGSVEPDMKWITNHSFWFGSDGVRMSRVYVNRQIDIALMKLENLNDVKTYPVFRTPESIIPGTSVCRLGFAFSEVKSEFLKDTKAFTIPKGILPLTFYPTEGMHTRDIVEGVTQDGFDRIFVDTSSPSFRGQSGGPLYDTEGRIYGINVRTQIRRLDFDNVMRPRDELLPEKQYANFGQAVHVRTLIEIMKKNNVSFTTSGEAVPAMPAAPPKEEPRDIDKDASGDTYIIE
jgi:hypothetical protein